MATQGKNQVVLSRKLVWSLIEDLETVSSSAERTLADIQDGLDDANQEPESLPDEERDLITSAYGSMVASQSAASVLRWLIGEHDDHDAELVEVLREAAQGIRGGEVDELEVDDGHGPGDES